MSQKTLELMLTAYENKEFFLEYMPQVNLKTGYCVGCEALIRWNHRGQLIMPDDFIPVAENTAMSGLLTYQVVEDVAEELGDWLRKNDNIHVGINIPPELIGRGGVEYAIRKSGIYDQMNKIVFEITERGFPDDTATATLNKFSSHRDSRIAVDDFGTGDAQLIKLASMDVDIIKIDKSFVSKIDNENKVSKIIKATVAFALAMEVEIIAEGVEDEVQHNVLRDLGVHTGQGWYYGTPMDAKEFLQYFNDHKEPSSTTKRRKKAK